MFKISILFALVFVSSLCGAVELVQPRLQPAEVIAKAEAYLLKNRIKTLQGYHLSQINFVYYSKYKVESGYWMLSYGCDEGEGGVRRSDCGFYLSASNSQTPEFYFRQING